MEIFNVITIIVVLTALFAYVNTRYIKLPNTIGLMLIAIVFSLLCGVANYIVPNTMSPIITSIKGLDFSAIVINVLLSFLLFAGALHTDFDQLKKQRASVILFAVSGVLLSTFFIGGILYFVLQLFSIQVPFLHCLLFGSFISPTDPIAVLGILTKANVPKKLEINIVGESLFNDGIGVVIFITILSIINNGADNFGTVEIVKLFAQEAIGGILFGLALGYIIYFLLKQIDDYETEVIITLAGVMGGSVLAYQLHVSAPLAMVVAGLMTGHKTKEVAMSDITALYVDKFWHLIDVLLNAVLFVLMGLKILAIQFELQHILIASILIPLFLLARYIALQLPFQFAKKYLTLQNKDIVLFTWGGLRGGLSIAMALSLTDKIPDKNMFVSFTFLIVIFSIFVQGLTVNKLVKKLYK